MDFYFAGAEQPVFMHKLEELGVTHIAISFYEWLRRHTQDDLYKHVPKSMSVCITPGVAKKDIDFEEFAVSYLEFCQRNADEATLIYDLDAPNCDPRLRHTFRNELSILPKTVMFPIDDEEASTLAGQYERIGINGRLSKSIPAADLRRLPASLYGSNVTDPKVLQLGKFVATASFAWMSGKRFGEIFVFARGRMHHYTAPSLAKAVRVHSEDITALGVDPLACLANDHDALTELAVRSLQAMTESLSKRPRDRNMAKAAGASPTQGGVKVVDGILGAPGALVNTGVPASFSREKTLLPVISMNTQDDRVKVESITSSLRQCDTCYLSAVCPKYEPSAECAYKVPVEIKTDAQWEAACQVLLEIQFQRVSFGHFAEQIEGGAITPRLGQEMDRFYKMLGSIKDLKTPTESAKDGALSRVFGDMAPPPAEELVLEPGNAHDQAEQDFEDAEGFEEEYEEATGNSARTPSS